MGCWGVACTGRRSRGHAERGLSKSPLALGEDEESANKIQCRVCKAVGYLQNSEIQGNEWYVNDRWEIIFNLNKFSLSCVGDIPMGTVSS